MMFHFFMDSFCFFRCLTEILGVIHVFSANGRNHAQDIYYKFGMVSCNHELWIVARLNKQENRGLFNLCSPDCFMGA